MPTPAEIRAAADAKLLPFWNKIRARQAIFLTNNGRYWQGLKTHVIRPADGTEAPPDATSTPTNEQTNWAAFAGVDLPATLPVSVRCDVYNGPQGRGFTATAEVKIGANVWERTVNEGPETGRTQAWRQRPPALIGNGQ